ncbi:MAG: aerotolerance protein BatA [Gemmatimonadales bacterium]|nr:hypothetical protein HRbin33_02266 [bacterium HR33]GIW51174.1 MAG: aerotolerance protein BatA [Gemmatimonadales bacterium]
MFARPELLLLLAALPLMWRRRFKKPANAVAFSDLSGMVPVSRGRRLLAELPAGLRSLAVAGLVLAAAGPQREVLTTEASPEGIDIVLVIDVSSSMLAEDFAPSNRLDVAKEQAIAFIRGRPHDRIGLVSFAAQAITRVPLTVDHAVVERAVLELKVGELEDGTAIGTGLATGVNRLRAAKGASKVAVLLTDGENNRGRVDPRTAADLAARFGIKVYTIGVGTEGEARVPISRDPVRYETMPVRLDEELLRDIASATGGRYFRATDREALRQIFQQIDRLEKTPAEATRYLRVEEEYRPFLIAALSALLLEMIFSATVAVRVP